MIALECENSEQENEYKFRMYDMVKTDTWKEINAVR